MGRPRQVDPWRSAAERAGSTNAQRNEVVRVDGFEGKVQFVWQVADLLRGDYKPAEYRGVILPLLVLRRLDAVLEQTKPHVLARADRCSSVSGGRRHALRHCAHRSKSPAVLCLRHRPSPSAASHLERDDKGARSVGLQRPPWNRLPVIVAAL